LKPRVAIIGSCVTRDVWNLAGFPDDARKDLLYLARTSFASLFAEPYVGFEAPDQPPPELTAWEVRMVADDVLKRGVGKLLEYRPTHLIVDHIDERFNLLRKNGAVVTHSWELHLTGLDEGPLKGLERIWRASDEATRLWRTGLDALAAFLKANLPDTRIIFHDARWALEYLDPQGARQAFAPDRELWPGIPANIAEHNRLLADYAAYLRAKLPQAFHVRAPAEIAVGDERHRWGLSPFHYTEAYYRYVWSRFQELGCGRPGLPTF
jgi:hypothetical protein